MEAERLEPKLRRELRNGGKRPAGSRKRSRRTQPRREIANAEARQVIETARAEVEDILRELTRSKNRVRKRISRANSTKRVPSSEEAQPGGGTRSGNRNVKKGESSFAADQAGDTVRLVNIGSTATVLGPPDENRIITVQAGIMKVKLNVSEVELVETDHAGTP